MPHRATPERPSRSCISVPCPSAPSHAHQNAPCHTAPALMHLAFQSTPDQNAPRLRFRASPLLSTPLHSCQTLPFHIVPRHNGPLHACHASTIPTVPLPSIPLDLTLHVLVNTGQYSPTSPCLPPQSLPDPDARRQSAFAIPCLLLLSYPSFPDPYGPCATLPANPCLFPCASVAIAVKPHHSMPASASLFTPFLAVPSVPALSLTGIIVVLSVLQY
jgi:hypothetical protein